MVSNLSIIFMILGILLSVAIPVVVGIVFHKKWKTSFACFFIGFATFVVFALVLEQLMHTLVLKSSVGDVIQKNIWLYAIYGGLAAGIFEETGRFVVMKTILKKKWGNPYNGHMYGIGHGGIEAILIFGMTMLNYVIYAMIINSGQTDKVLSALPKDVQGQMQVIFNDMIAAKPWEFLVGLVERISAMTLHVGLSVFVWIAASRKKTIWFPVAILIHAFVDAVMAVIARINIMPVALLELLIFVMAVLTCLGAFGLWKKVGMTSQLEENS